MIDSKTISGLKASLALLKLTAEGPSTRLLDDIQAVIDSLEEAQKFLEDEQQANIDLHQRLFKAERERDQAVRWKEAYREVGIKNWKMWCGEYERATDQKPMVPNELKKESEDAVDAEAKRIVAEGK